MTRKKKIPENNQHHCAVSGQLLPEDQLLRMVVGPDGQVMADSSCRLPAAALWIACHRQTVQTAIAAALFKHLHPEAYADTALPEKIAFQLRRQCLDLLALGKKSGMVISGYEKVRAALGKGTVALLLEAQDSGAHAALHVPPAMRALIGETVRLFNSDELSAVIGKQHVIHIALRSGKLTERIVLAIHRLRDYI